MSDRSMLPISAARGRSSMQYRGLENFDYYTDVVGQTKESNTRVLNWIQAGSGPRVYYPNLNRKIIENEPATEFKYELLNEKEFRQALSIAINRQPIIDSIYYGLTEPRQVSPGPLSPFENENLAYSFINYDPEKANQMLDDVWRKLGADPDKRISGYRCTPDGKLLTFYLTRTVGKDHTSQFVIKDWGKVGIRLIDRQVSRILLKH